MRYITMIAVATCSAATAGCVTTDPVPAGNGQYLVSRENYLGLGTRSGQREDAIEKAKTFCAENGGKVPLIGGSSSHGVPGITPVGSSLTFSCVETDNTDYQKQQAAFKAE